MELRELTEKECHDIVRIHLVAFHGFFLSMLGKRFLNTYYKANLKCSDSICTGTFNEKGEIIGFCIGTILSKGYHKRLILANKMAFLLQGIFLIITNPKALIRLLNNLNKNGQMNDNGQYAELLSIAVSPNVKGLGIGQKMIAYFETEAKARGCKKIALTTDYYNNDNVIAFYKKNKYEVFYEFTTYPQRRMYKLIKNLEQ